MIRRLIFLIFLEFFASFAVFGVSIVNINEGVVLVKGQYPQRDAMRQVLVKMTGSQESLSNTGVLQALKDANDYILSYEYYFEDNQRKYKAVFDKVKIEALIRQEKLPLWGAQRPEAIVWLAFSNANGINVVADNDNSNLRKAVKQYSQARGVQMLLPLMDLDDALALSKTDVWARFLPVLQKASERYNSEYLVTARIISTKELQAQHDIQHAKKIDNGYIDTHKLHGIRGFDRDALTLDVALQNEDIRRKQTPSTLSETRVNDINIPDEYSLALEWYIQSKKAGDNSDIWSGREFGDDVDSLIQTLIDIYTNNLGEKYAIVTGDMPSVRPVITVSNIQSLKDIVTLTRYLEALTVVDSTRLVTLQGNLATFEISLLGAMNDLHNTLGLGTRLTAIKTNDAIAEASNEKQPLHFFWQG